MNKYIETNASAIETANTESFATIETLDLDNVTGGCAACGCSSPTTAPAQGAAGGGSREIKKLVANAASAAEPPKGS